MLREQDIKAALIDWLYEKRLVDDAVIINEMVVANWARRVDIAVANGRLHAFEIKSDADSLKRLPGQVEFFSKHFDKLVLVVASRFVSSVISQYPVEVGVIEVFSTKSGIRMRQVRAGRIIENKDVKALSGFLTKADIAKILRLEGLPSDAGMRRAALVSLLDNIPVRTLRGYVMDIVKGKYKETFNAFHESRSIAGAYASLPLLSRRELEMRTALREDEKMSCSNAKPNPNARAVNLEAMKAFFDDIELIPATVICRSLEN